MAVSINRVTLLGYVGNDPEIKRFGERGVVSFSLATTESWKDKQTQEWKEKTEWHRISAWTPLADVIMKKVKKGSRVYCEGKVKYEQWQDREGNTKYATKIEIRELVVLDPKTSTPEAAVPKSAEDFKDFPDALNNDDDDLPF